MFKIRLLTVLMLVMFLMPGAFFAQAQDGTCTIDLDSARLALDEAQQLADSGDHFGATQLIIGVQQDLGALTDTCIESLYSDWAQYVWEDKSLSLRYPSQWTVMEDAETLGIASSPDLFGSDFNLAAGQQMILVTVNGLDDFDVANFDSILSDFGSSFGGGSLTPVMLEVSGHTAGRFTAENQGITGVVELIDYLDQDNPSVVVIIMLGMSSEQSLWLPLLDQVGASLRYPSTGETVSEAIPDVVLQDIPGWRYAVNTDTKNLVAYQLNGETHDLLPDVTFVAILADLGNDRVLAHVFGDDDQESLHILNPDSAQSVMTGFEDFTIPQKQLDNFLLLRSRDAQVAPAGIFNTETGVFSQLAGRIPASLPDRCCTFSEDGTHIRYLSTETPDGDFNFIWTLRERDLLSGEDQVVFTLDEFQGVITPSVYPYNQGEQWLGQAYDRETKHYITIVYGLDGSRQVLEDEPQETAAIWGRVDELFYRHALLCSENCSLDLRATVEGDAVQYAFPPADRINILNRISDNRLLLMHDITDLYIIYPDKAPFLLGFLTLQLIRDISSDGNWALLQDQKRNPEHYIIWNLQEERIIEQLSADEVGAPRYVIYSPNGQVWSFDSGNTVIVDKLGRVTKLPSTEERRIYFEVLDDGSLLYTTVPLNTDAPGIYRLNPSSGESVLVQPGDYRPGVLRSR